MDGLHTKPGAQAAMRGTKPAVMGLLRAALYNSVWTSAAQGSADFAVATKGFVLLIIWRATPLFVVVLSALAGIGMSFAT